MANLRSFTILLPITVFPKDDSAAWTHEALSFSVDAVSASEAAKDVSEALKAYCNKHIDETRRLIANYNMRHPPQIEPKPAGEVCTKCNGMTFTVDDNGHTFACHDCRR